MQHKESPVPETAEDVATLCEENPQLAAASFHELVTSSEVDGSALMLAAYGFHLLDRHDSEVDALERLVSMEPGAYGSLKVLADALMEVGREQEARVAFRDALQLCADSPGVVELAEIVADWELYDVGVDVARRWTALESRSPAAHELLGISLGKTGDHTAAADAFQDAAELDPDERRHRYNLAEALARSGRMLEGWRAFWGDPGERDHGPTTAVLFENPIEVNWASDGSELIRRMSYEGERRLPLLSSQPGWHETVADAFVLELESPALRTRLVIEPRLSYVQFSVESTDGGPVQDADLVLWRLMVNNCLAAIGEDRGIPWYALIGTRPVSNFEASDQQLTARGRLGDLELHPCPRVREHVGSPALRNEVVRHISPVAVEGVCHEFHGWGVDAEEETVAVRRLCAFLSLVWNSAWEAKVAPQPGYADELTEKLEVADVVPDNNLHSAVRGVQLESWMEEALARLGRDDALQNAAHVFHEAMLLFKNHPSVAAMRFVTCCEVLGGRQNPSRGRSRAKVRATFESVLPKDEAEDLLQAYERRNETAHEARYHGLELSEGLEGYDPLTTHYPGSAFTVGLLNRLRNVTRDALLSALR